MVYSAFFDGCNLLSLQPQSFEQARLEKLPESLKNPKIFTKFFNLKSPFGKRQKQEGKSKKFDYSKVLHLFDTEEAESFSPSMTL